MAEENEQVQDTDSQAQAPSLIMDNDAPQEPHPLADDSDAGKSDDAASGGSQEDKGGESEDSEGGAVTPEQPKEQPAQPQQPTNQVERLEDPGEFKPNDYSFDVKLADGTAVHITSPEDFANIPKDADFGDPKNFMDVQANYVRMVNGLETDRKTYEETQAAYEKQVEADGQFEQRVQTMMNEFAYLETNGDLPAVPKQYENADWSDPEVAKQPGVKERIELLTLRKEENDKRTKVGLPPIGILETKTLMENRAFKEAATQREQKQNDMRKQRGAMVAGPSAPEPSNRNSDMIVGAGGSLRDLGY